MMMMMGWWAKNGKTLIFIYMKRKANVSSITQRYGLDLWELTLHSTFYTLHSTFYTLHSTFCISLLLSVSVWVSVLLSIDTMVCAAQHHCDWQLDGCHRCNIRHRGLHKWHFSTYFMKRFCLKKLLCHSSMSPSIILMFFLGYYTSWWWIE